MGGLVLLIVALLAESPTSPYWAPSMSVPARALIFLFVGPGLGPIVAALGLLSFWWPRYRILFGTALVPLSLFGVFEGGLGGLFVGPALGVLGGLSTIGFESQTYESAVSDGSGLPGWFQRNYAVVPVAFLVVGLAFAVIAPAFASFNCPTPAPCLPTGACPAIETAGCGGPPVWILALVSAVFTCPLAFRLRVQQRGIPMPA